MLVLHNKVPVVTHCVTHKEKKKPDLHYYRSQISSRWGKIVEAVDTKEEAEVVTTVRNILEGHWNIVGGVKAEISIFSPVVC